jgi:hypothetical protein
LPGLAEKYRPALWTALLCIACFVLLIVPYPTSGSADREIVYSFFAIICISATGIFTDPRPYSFNKIFWIFNLVFIGIVPCYQYEKRQMAWELFFPENIFLHANLLIIACLIVYICIRSLAGKIRQKASKLSNNVTNEKYLKAFKASVLVYTACCMSLVFMYGFKNLWFRQNTDAAVMQMNGSLLLLLDKGLRGATMYFSLLSVYLFRRKIISIQWLLLTLAFCITVNFPASLPRFYAACLYISILLAFNIKWLRQRNFFAVFLLAAVLIAYPVFSLTRWSHEELKERFHGVGSIYESAFRLGDFDAYTSICKTVGYVSDYGTTHGRQLATVFLFFVPRSMWQGKAVGSGALIYTPKNVDINEYFHNYSCSFYAEGYINFGDVGSILFIAVLAVIIACYDNWYWQFKNHEMQARPSFGYLFYPAAIIMLFFMLRGDLLSSYAYLCGFFVSGWAFHKMFTGIAGRNK